jgi:hypothetical protein
MQPTYTHDCEFCKFLGTIESDYYNHDNGVMDKIDLYFCGTDKPYGNTVVARRSSEGSDYSSGMIFAIGSNPNPLLAEARKRAIEKGYYTCYDQEYTER